MQCIYLRKLCKTGCDNYQCRAFFPDTQPLVMKKDLPICQSDEHVDCVRFNEGEVYQEERRLKRLKQQCPYASNTVCGKPWDWWCKGRVPPFELTLPLKDEKGIIQRDENGEILFERGYEDIKDTCLSGDPEVYEACPYYKQGEEFRETWRKTRGIT